jgi:hypothetical protein
MCVTLLEYGLKAGSMGRVYSIEIQQLIRTFKHQNVQNLSARSHASKIDDFKRRKEKHELIRRKQNHDSHRRKENFLAAVKERR